MLKGQTEQAQTEIHPTCDNMWVDVEGVIDGVNAALLVVPLAERQRAAVHTDARHVRVAPQ